MCNLHSLNKKRDMLARFFRVSHNRSAAFEPVPAIFPGHVPPVVRQSADGEREITLMSWGLVLLQKERAPRRATNIRDDKILESRFWRNSFEERRCLVPASSFCEPNGDVKPATWHWFGLRGSDERPLFAFPGIWRRYQGPLIGSPALAHARYPTCPSVPPSSTPRVVKKLKRPRTRSVIHTGQVCAEPTLHPNNGQTGHDRPYENVSWCEYLLITQAIILSAFRNAAAVLDCGHKDSKLPTRDTRPVGQARGHAAETTGSGPRPRLRQ
jgi:SOS response associated peptidase (SRAP)